MRRKHTCGPRDVDDISWAFVSFSSLTMVPPLHHGCPPSLHWWWCHPCPLWSSLLLIHPWSTQWAVFVRLGVGGVLHHWSSPHFIVNMFPTPLPCCSLPLSCCHSFPLTLLSFLPPHPVVIPSSSSCCCFLLLIPLSFPPPHPVVVLPSVPLLFPFVFSVHHCQ